MNKIETTINFGGFYHSIHDGNIESMIESSYDGGSYPEYNFENIDYKKTEQSYIENYCSKFTNYILNEYGFTINFKDLKTDKIDCFVSKTQSNKLTNHFKKNDDFLKFLKDRTHSYDGYWSFYTFDEALNNKDNKLIMYLLEFLSNEFNEKEVVYGEIEFEIHLLKEVA